MMAGNPSPTKVSVTTSVASLPQPSVKPSPDRDDNLESWPADYRVTDLVFDYTLRNPYGGAPISRQSHAKLAIPTGPPPPGGFHAVLALNGHFGSAQAIFNPDDLYFWYGDAYARRGYVVLAVDVSHRPVEDRRGLYPEITGGDDPANGNGPHPAIKAAGFDSDFEEDGERAWDAMRALDHLLTLPFVNRQHVLVTGMSLGAEITTVVGALDPRLAAVVPSEFSPDLGVLYWHGNHPCWEWLNANIRDYIDVSDLQSLVAPRPLIVESGKIDFIFSGRPEPFATDKEVLRRTRAAYADTPDRLLHYLHYDGHHYHVGDIEPGKGALGICVPLEDEPQENPSEDWEDDASTLCTPPTTLFTTIPMMLP
jgi:hypothetical protein